MKTGTDYCDEPKSLIDNLTQPQAVFELKMERGKFIIDYTIGINKGDL